mmetsp:Transcript_13334/g.40197  ORF Transcript_13334/g.40197 Transcript_13334/m.40197 type:complete len:281 (+) Transcript_13334:965-1807(+)
MCALSAERAPGAIAEMQFPSLCSALSSPSRGAAALPSVPAASAARAADAGSSRRTHVATTDPSPCATTTSGEVDPAVAARSARARDTTERTSRVRPSMPPTRAPRAAAPTPEKARRSASRDRGPACSADAPEVGAADSAEPVDAPESRRAGSGPALEEAPEVPESAELPPAEEEAKICGAVCVREKGGTDALRAAPRTPPRTPAPDLGVVERLDPPAAGETETAAEFQLDLGVLPPPVGRAREEESPCAAAAASSRSRGAQYTGWMITTSSFPGGARLTA